MKLRKGLHLVSKEYQRVIFVASHGRFADGRAWLMDTSGIVYWGDLFVPFPGVGFNY